MATAMRKSVETAMRDMRASRNLWFLAVFYSAVAFVPLPASAAAIPPHCICSPTLTACTVHAIFMSAVRIWGVLSAVHVIHHAFASAAGDYHRCSLPAATLYSFMMKIFTISRELVLRSYGVLLQQLQGMHGDNKTKRH